MVNAVQWEQPRVVALVHIRKALTMTKRLSNLSLACTDADKAAAERVRRMGGPFPPSTSLLLLLFIRHGMLSVLRGELTLEYLSNKYSAIDLEPVAALAARQETR